MRATSRLLAALCVAGWLTACGAPATATAPPLPAGTVVTWVPLATPAATAILTAAAAASPAASPQVTQTPAGTPANPDRTAGALAFAHLFLAGDYAAVVDRFDATMKRVFPLDKVKEAAESLEPRLGAFRRIPGTRVERYEQAGTVYDIVYVTCEFEKQTIDLKVVYDPEGLVAGLFFVPTQSTVPEAFDPPAYVDPTAFREEEVTVGSGEWALPGTLTIPLGRDEPFPALVLVHGSGPNDRDETIGPNKPFRDLAWGLASQGIAVLRYEKRTREHADKFTEDVLLALTSKEETTDDALASVALLRDTAGVDPAGIYVLGHSLGAYLLPRIGAADPRLAGLIFLAGPTRPLEDLMYEQIRYILGLDGSISPEEQTMLDELALQVALVKDPNLTAAARRDGLPLGTPASFWLDLRGYNPAEVARGLPQRLLILQGGRDYQVTTVDFEGWQAALASRPDARLKLYPDLNHLFISGDGLSTPAEYEIEGHVAEEVITDIATWILRR